MKRKIVFLFALLIVSSGFFACTKMLDLDPDGRVSIKDVFKTYYRTEAYFNSCYNYVPQVSFNYDGSTALASFCDEAHDSQDKVDGGVTGWYKGWTSSSYNPLTANYVDHWSNDFAGIRKCNSFLKYISDPEIATYNFDADQKAGWIAQIKVLRAYYYLMLIKRYGGVPILSTPYEENHDYSTDKRATFEQCVTFIIEECDAALATPIVSGGAFGFRWDRTGEGMRSHMTRGVAWAIKSQAALYAASPLWYKPGSVFTWDKVTLITKEALDRCLEHGFKLYDTPLQNPSDAQNPFAQYFFSRSDVTAGWDKETIHDPSVQRTNVWKNAGVPITAGMVKAGSCPSQELVDAFETIDGEPILNLQTPYLDADHLLPNYNATNSTYDPNNPYANRDPRFYASVYYNLSPRNLDNVTDNLVETYVGGNCQISDKFTDTRFTRTGYYMRKFNNWRSGISNDGDGLIRYFRLAELYLNFVEAANNSVGPDTQVPSVVAAGVALSAREAINSVRARVQMPPIASGLTTAQFELRYRNERRVEFAFEEHRFFDVRRWKILDKTDKFVTGMKITKVDPTTYTYQRVKLAQRPTWADKYLMFPINQNEVNKMNILTGDNWQNPGW